MSTLTDVPNEVLVNIIGQLQDESWEGYPFNFDPAITTVLQNVRLVCKRLNAVGASFLFENMIYDEELYSSTNNFRLRDFALQYPHLAIQVRRLQWKVQPSYKGAEQFARMVGFIIIEDTNSTKMALANRMMRLLIEPYQAQLRVTNRPPKFPRTQNDLNVPLDHDRLNLTRFLTLQSVVQLLPKLNHLELAASTTYRRHTEQVVAHLLQEENIDVVDIHETIMSMMESFNLESLCSYVRDRGMPAIASLKLLDNSLTSPESLRWQNLLHLQRLDLEFRITKSHLDIGLPAKPVYAAQYRAAISELVNLRTFRLTGKGDWDEVYWLVHPRAAGLKDSSGEVFFVDSLLGDNHYPKLRSLSVACFPVRAAGLSRIIRNHPQLQYLELRKLTAVVPRAAFPGAGLLSWKGVAKACATLPALRRVMFDELHLHIDGLVENNDGPEPIQEIQHRGVYPSGMTAMYRLSGSPTTDGWIRRDGEGQVFERWIDDFERLMDMEEGEFDEMES